MKGFSMLDAASDLFQAEPLVRIEDLAEYRQGLARHLSGEWDAEQWTAYRVRFGVYGQKQPGVQMVRIKIPGGVVPVAWLKVLADVNRTYAVGDAHFTTRQDVQIYSIALDKTPDLLESLYSRGITTREACGNTLRNMNACALAGACPRELVDAGRVAEQLTTAWMRNPLVQHMPRKAKFTVSGCATDCGATSIHDLGFIAVEKDGRPGFRIMAAGGLGGMPRPAVEVLDFVTEEQLGAVVEAFARLHHRYSDRRNRNAARIKYVAKRFGEEKFRALFQEEFDRVIDLPRRPWAPLAWRKPAQADIWRGAPVGVQAAHDGSSLVVVSVPLGIVSSDQLDELAAIAERAGVSELRITRDQNVAFLGVAADTLATVVDGVRAIGFDVPAGPADVPEVISCPGTTTCRIGITNSQNFGRRLVDSTQANVNAKGLSVHVSGCQNSCGLHHVADFGFHGAAKKVDGRSAPHYQLHLGGDARTGEIGIGGPTIPSKLADRALDLLIDAYQPARQGGESVRAWADRLGKDGIAAILAPLDGVVGDDLFQDWGDDFDFPGAPQAKGECAAPFAMDDLYTDMADDALISIDRALFIKDHDRARAAGSTAQIYALRRFLHVNNVVSTDSDDLAQLRGQAAAFLNGDVAAAFAGAQAAEDGDLGCYREAIALMIDTVRAYSEKAA